jgi:hypothetical protein
MVVNPLKNPKLHAERKKNLKRRRVKNQNKKVMLIPLMLIPAMMILAMMILDWQRVHGAGTKKIMHEFQDLPILHD